jgi:hypothetical protein
MQSDGDPLFKPHGRWRCHPWIAMRSVRTLFKRNRSLSIAKTQWVRSAITFGSASLRPVNAKLSVHQNIGLSPNRRAQEEQDSHRKRTAQRNSYDSSPVRQAHEIQHSRKYSQ